MSPVFQREQNTQEGQHQAYLHTLLELQCKANFVLLVAASLIMFYRPTICTDRIVMGSKNLLVIKECQQKLDPDLNPWLQLRSEQLRSGAGHPVHMCPFCSLKSWETLQGWYPGIAWEGWRDAPSHKCRVSELHRMSGCSLLSGYMLVKCCPTSSWSCRQFCWYSWVFAPGI